MEMNSNEFKNAVEEVVLEMTQEKKGNPTLSEKTNLSWIPFHFDLLQMPVMQQKTHYLLAYCMIIEQTNRTAKPFTKSVKVLKKSVQVTLLTGQCVGSLRYLLELLQPLRNGSKPAFKDISAIRRFLKTMVECNLFELDKSQGITIITILTMKEFYSEKPKTT